MEQDDGKNGKEEGGMLMVHMETTSDRKTKPAAMAVRDDSVLWYGLFF